MFVSQAPMHWKVFGILIALTASTLQAVDWFAESINIHFLIPLLMQVAVSLAVIVHASLEDIDRGW